VLPSQPEKERSNLNLDWRKRVAFAAELKPATMNRFDCRIEMLPRKPLPGLREEDGQYRFRTKELSVIINAETGLMDEYSVNGVSYLHAGAFAPIIVQDDEDSWRMNGQNVFSPVIGRFKLMDERTGSEFTGVKTPLSSVRVVEDGAVRTVIEAVLAYRQSSICITYKLPKQGSEVEVQLRVYWNEKDKMLKLSIPTVLKSGAYRGQTAFGIHDLAGNGQECVSHKWVCVECGDSNQVVTCINNGIYGSDYEAGEIRLSLLRSSGYCAHPIYDRPILAQDRFSPRMDQGERSYSFWLNAGRAEERLPFLDREATVRGEAPYALSFFPSGEGGLCGTAIELEDGSIQLSAFKKEERGDGYILRLFEPTGEPRSTFVSIPRLGIREEIRMNGFEIITMRLDPAAGTLSRSNLCESHSGGGV